jgi:hypothetical protein
MSPHIREFILGASRALDMGGTLSLRSVSGVFLDDAEAIANDWKVVGRDMAKAMGQIAKPDGE